MAQVEQCPPRMRGGYENRGMLWTTWNRSQRCALQIARGALLFLCSLAVVRAQAEPAQAEREFDPGLFLLLRSSDAPVDLFHPDHQRGPDGALAPLPRPARGGKVRVHIESIPDHLNYALANKAAVRRVLNELHATLLSTDLATLQLEPALARSFVREDLLVLKTEHAGLYPQALRVSAQAPACLFGALAERDGRLELAPRSPHHPLTETLRVDPAHVERRLAGAVITFQLRPNAVWHPSPGFEHHLFDAHDVAFSFSIYANPHVLCDERRGAFASIARCDELDRSSVRFFVLEPHFQILETLGEMVLLPAHLFDLKDPDHPAFDAQADAAACAEAINHNRHNRAWIGLGPYRLVSIDESTIEAERFPDYFDSADAGFVDHIQWRYLPDEQAFTALEAGQLDFFDRVNSERFFGPATKNEAFARRYYRGFSFQGGYNFIAWNLRRKLFEDVRVRRALAHCFDSQGFLDGYYHGVGQPVTGPFARISPAYDESVAVPALDFERARALMLEAGWYDRDGDGYLDRDGQRFAFDLLMPAGNDTSMNYGLVLQAGLERIGVECRLQALEFNRFSENYRNREFDAAALAWAPAVETDPEPNWHSRWAKPDVRGSNAVGLADPEVDRLIEAGQRTFDVEARMAIWQALHRRIAELQPCLFLHNPPRKFVLNRALRGHQTSRLDPGYAIRRWYYPEGTPGTRPLAGEPR